MTQSEPGLENFYFLKAEKPMWPASANVFVIKDREGLIFIDVGCGRGVRNFPKRFFRKLERLNLRSTLLISPRIDVRQDGQDFTG